MLKEKLDTRKCFATAWGKLITEEEAYEQLNRQIAAMTANLFQVMRIFEPSWEKRTAAICDIANMMNMAVAGSPEDQKAYVNQALYEAFNIPELCEKSSWLGGITGDSGDEWENMHAQKAADLFADICPKAEVNLINGGQPVYYYMISAE